MLKQLLSIIGIILLITILLMYFFQRRLLYFPDPQIPNLKNLNAEDMQTVNLDTKDNLRLSSWYKPAENQAPTVLILHGNAGNISYRIPLAHEWIKAGFGVFLLEYRGYGGNPGSPTEQGLYQDADAALQFLEQQGLTSKNIILFGESLGTAIATKLAAEHAFACVILQSPLTSMTSLARYHYPWALLAPWDKFDSLSRIKDIRAPLLILHGKRDSIVPFTQGETLYKEANYPKQMLSFDLQDHNDIREAPGFYEKVIDFAKTSCLKL